jgi:6,7-dimethyl-8-ribityllumazine synthase
VDALVAQGANPADSNSCACREPYDLPLIARRSRTRPLRCDRRTRRVIRGETAHFDFVAGECAAGLARVAGETGVPVAFGVLTTENEEQAMARAAAARATRVPTQRSLASSSPISSASWAAER